MKIERYEQIAALNFDDIIDVRSPAEFDEDHIPGAVNLPVLDDAERAEVGTCYVQVSRFKARRMGAALVARNAAHHLETALADKGPEYRPLVYCWRGGQRSEAFATILNSIGWQAETLEGGYKTYRHLVWDLLYETPLLSPVVLLDGNTGTAKTRLLTELSRIGVQTIDLEGLAHHRGSLFGGEHEPQPAQKGFESSLADRIGRLDPAQPVVIEAESSLIGSCVVPPSVLQPMRQAPRIVVDAPIEQRARFVVESYADLVADPAELDARIKRLRPYHSVEQVEEWLGMSAAGAFEALAQDLMSVHYDPRYEKQRMLNTRSEAVEVAIEDLSDGGLAAVAPRIAALLPELTDA